MHWILWWNLCSNCTEPILPNTNVSTYSTTLQFNFQCLSSCQSQSLKFTWVGSVFITEYSRSLNWNSAKLNGCSYSWIIHKFHSNINSMGRIHILRWYWRHLNYVLWSLMGCWWNKYHICWLSWSFVTLHSHFIYPYWLVTRLNFPLQSEGLEHVRIRTLLVNNHHYSFISFWLDVTTICEYRGDKCCNFMDCT